MTLFMLRHGGPVALSLPLVKTPAALGRAFGLLAAATLMVAASAEAHAGCLVDMPGAKCVNTVGLESTDKSAHFQSVPTKAPAFEIGKPLPDDYMMLLNSEYYGLPPVENGWVYFRVDRHVVRADYHTREVLEDVTHMTNRAFF